MLKATTLETEGSGYPKLLMLQVSRMDLFDVLCRFIFLEGILIFYAWFTVAQGYVKEKIPLHAGVFGRDHRLKRETDFFHTAASLEC